MKIFISFSVLDKKFAEQIYYRLKDQGLDCWIASKNILPGHDYQASIVEAINASDLVVLVFSSNANNSNEIAKELSLASKKIIIPVRIENVLPQGAFLYQLTNRQFIDLFDDFNKKLDVLTYEIKSLIKKNGLHSSSSYQRLEPSSNKIIIGQSMFKTLFFATLIIAVIGIGYYLLSTNKQNVAIENANNSSNVNNSSNLNKVNIQPSFNCAKAGNTVEHLICASNSLAQLDIDLSHTYINTIYKHPEQKQALKLSQRAWLSELHAHCKNAECVKNDYINRINLLKNWDGG